MTMRPNEHSRLLKQRADAATRYLEQRNYDSYQKNGQRVSTHNTMKVDESSGDGFTEVFVGKLPRDLFEDELLPKLEKAGRVQKMRLMMDFSCSNRGFAFAKYVTPAEAAAACKLLNKTLIRIDHPPIGVLPSFDNKKLFLGNLPHKLTKDRLRTELEKIISGVEGVHLPDCLPKQNSCYAFVTFKNHEAATQARRVLCPGDIKICDRVVSVEWAKPELQVPDQQSQSPVARNNSIYIDKNDNCTATTTTSLSNNTPPLLRPGIPPPLVRRQPLTNRTHRNNNINNYPKKQGPASTPPRPICSPSGERMPFNVLASAVNDINNNKITQSIIPLGMVASATSTVTPNWVAPAATQETPSILGEKTRQMLAACPPDPSCTIIIENINLNLLDETKLKFILQLHHFTVTKMSLSAPTTLEVTYADQYEAALMANLLNQYPLSFVQLAVPGRELRANRSDAYSMISAF